MFGLLRRERSIVADELLHRMKLDCEEMEADKKAREITRPIVVQVRDAINAAYRRGARRPSVVCLGRKQEELIHEARFTKIFIGPEAKYIHGLKIIWTGDADHVSVHEQRKYAWV